MSNKPVIEVKGLSKSYQINHKNKASYSTIKDDLTNLITRPFSGGTGASDKRETFWALKDIDFTVNQGETFGIIGQNGSGKSTLLKMLSRIVTPTSGTARIRGHVASLLEVGTGFHPELTGRENIFFNGSMIGMSKREIKSKFDEIVAFSEVEKFLDTPVKYYSSGMYVRLAFSVAAHLDSEIVIIDEVLAVGDASFQKKSLKKMMSIAQEGRTVLFVSHSMGSVEELCSQVILLKNGRIAKHGRPHEVIGTYNKQNETSKVIREKNDGPEVEGAVKITDVTVTNHKGSPRIRSFDRLIVRIRLDDNIKKFKTFNLQAGFHDPDKRSLFRAETGTISVDKLDKDNWIEFETGELNLNPTHVYIAAALFIDDKQSDFVRRAATFDILPPSDYLELESYNSDLATIITPITFKYRD